MIAYPARILATLLLVSTAGAAPQRGGGDALPPTCTTAQPAPGRVDGEARDDQVGDTGIQAITLDPRALNVVLSVAAFNAGDAVVTWTVGRLDSLAPGFGEVVVTDMAGNTINCTVELAPEGDCNGNGIADSVDLASFTSYDWNGNTIPDECEQLGIVYCSPQNHNSTGQPAFLIVTGSNRVADNDVRLTAHNLPLESFGYFALSRSSAFIPASVATSSGNLCLGGPRGGYNASVLRSGTTGIITMPLDLTSGLPYPSEPGGLLTVLPGTTVFFQTWFRDAAALVRDNNLSDAVEVLFL
ncbi:MAG: hypothetical protein ACJAQ3_000788 [Planctomycetota bacterium]|jgi:hypothetical protein